MDAIIFSKFYAAHNDAIQIERKCWRNIEWHFLFLGNIEITHKQKKTHNLNSKLWNVNWLHAICLSLLRWNHSNVSTGIDSTTSVISSLLNVVQLIDREINLTFSADTTTFVSSALEIISIYFSFGKYCALRFTHKRIAKYKNRHYDASPIGFSNTFNVNCVTHWSNANRNHLRCCDCARRPNATHNSQESEK